MARSTAPGTVDGRVLWLDPAAGAPEPVPEPPVSGTVDTDICIVGGGFLGLWTALKILEEQPGADVCVVEARTCGFGASGRNAGFAMTLWSKAASLVGRADRQEAARLAHASADALHEIERFCIAEDIDAKFRMPGWLWTATAPAQVDSWSATVAAAESLGASPFVALSKAEVRERMGTPNVFGGVFESMCATVDPGRLVLGLRAAALRRGIRVFEHSPVLDVDRASQRVRCPQGTVSCRQLVLATNAWLAKLRELRRVIVPVSADAIATEPVPGFFETGWSGGEAWTNSSSIVDFARPTDDRRIVIGRGAAAMAYAAHLGAGFLHNPPRTREISTALATLIPALAGAGVTHSWSGPVDRTFDGLPIVGHLPGSRVLFAGGFSGNGVGPSLVFGRMLASLALGRTDEWSTSSYIGIPDYRFPPEPVRYLGGRMIRRAVREQIAAVDGGRPVSPLVNRLVALYPSGLMKVKS
jgi:glycine/D-amino acid oxidase-like deaminating enzyme